MRGSGGHRGEVRRSSPLPQRSEFRGSSVLNPVTGLRQ